MLVFGHDQRPSSRSSLSQGWFFDMTKVHGERAVAPTTGSHAGSGSGWRPGETCEAAARVWERQGSASVCRTPCQEW